MSEPRTEADRWGLFLDAAMSGTKTRDFLREWLEDATTEIRAESERPVPASPSIDAVVALANEAFATAASSLRGDVPDAGHEMCRREWAAQQVGYYARSWFNDKVAALPSRPSSPPVVVAHRQSTPQPDPTTAYAASGEAGENPVELGATASSRPSSATPEAGNE